MPLAGSCSHLGLAWAQIEGRTITIGLCRLRLIRAARQGSKVIRCLTGKATHPEDCQKMTRDLESLGCGVVDHNQQVFCVGYDDKLLLLGSQPQQFHFILQGACLSALNVDPKRNNPTYLGVEFLHQAAGAVDKIPHH